MKEKISNFLWGQILMPPKKTQEIRRRKKIMKEACEKDRTLGKIFEEEYTKEKKEALSMRKRVQFFIISVVVLFLIGCWIRWTVPKLLALKIGSFVFRTAVTLFVVGVWMAVIRAYLDVLYKAYLGAEIAASDRYDELRKAEEASKEAAQGSGPTFDPELMRAYAKGARQARAKRTKG